MTRLSCIAAALVVTFITSEFVAAHCQVPCGIYGDQRRFEELLEDTDTIAKAITQIGELAGADDANGSNQLSRWVSTKEDHATNMQSIIGQYFLAQRIKPDAENYVDQLKAAHGVIVAAMKCKQAADPATADALRSAVHNLYRAYTGKEPQVEAKHVDGAIPVSIGVGHEHGHADHPHTHGDHDHAQGHKGHHHHADDDHDHSH
jgi:nickel superoxide dismutase